MFSKETWIALGTVIVVTAVSLGANEARKPSGLFSGLKVGQSMSLKDEASTFTITFFEPDLPQSQKVIEVRDNFIVVRDFAEISETTIPIYSAKAIVKVKGSKP